MMIIVGVLAFGAAALLLYSLLPSSMTHRQAAIAMSFGAGAATGIGASFVLCTRSLDRRLLACTMAFSAGVMIYVSLVEVVTVSTEHFEKVYPHATAYAFATASLFAGMVVMAVVDQLVHHVFGAISGEHSRHDHGAHTHEPHDRSDEESGSSLVGTDEPFEDESGASIRAVAHMAERQQLLMMSAVVSAAIVLHNIPEGMATYVASFHSISAGIPLCIAIAIHNIPEGLAVAMPIYYATQRRGRAIALGALSGMSEPFGALLASLIANERADSSVFGGMFGLTAGMMVYVCVAELLPAAYRERAASSELITLAFCMGCAVMAASLVIEQLATASKPEQGEQS